MNPPPTASLIVTPGQVIDSAATGSTAQPTRTLAISSTGQGAVTWAAQRAHGAAWLSFDITSGTTPTALSLSFNPASLSPGVYRDTVVLAPTVVPGEATRVPVEFRIQPCTVTPISLDVLVNDSLRTTDCAAPHGTGQFARLYSFHASAGDSVSVYTSASAFGVVLALDSSPSSAAPVLARSADCPLARQSACMVYRLLPQTGTYVVELASAATGQTGKFAVSVVPPHPPLVPDSLGQFQMDSVTPIHVGAAITQATLVFRGVVRDFDLSDSLSLQVEGRPLGSAFTGAPTASGSVVANGARASVAAGGLADNVAYHWQARVLDPTGRASAWVAFGNNPESAADFLVAVPQAPSGPTGASQLQADGTTPIALGGTDDGQSVVLMAMVADPDPNDQLRLEAEAQPVGTPFSNAPTASSTPVANGGTAVVTISGLTDNTAYHWQVRTVDQTALASPWSSFGANPEPDADFRVALAPTRLVVIAQPTNSPAGAAISPAVRVAAQDALGNTLASFTGDVTVTIGTNLMGGALSGATTVTAVAGVATFPRLSINRAGTGYTLQFNTSALATISAAFNVTPAAIAQLVFTQQPTTTIAGNVIAPVIQVAARDSSGNTVTNFTGAVTIGVATNPGGGTLSGTATVAAIGGVATFANLSIDKVAAGYILQVSSGAFTASSGAFDIAAAAGAQLRFAVQPTDATAGAAIAPAVTVTAVDPFGNIATSYTGSVTVGLGTNPGGGALAGSSSVAAVAGVARFTGLSVDKTGTGYTISAAAAGLAGATSSAFTITPAGTTRVAFTLQPSSSTIAGAAVTPAVQVSAQDAFGNTVPSFTGTISLALGSNPTGGVLAGGTTVAAVNGVASFADLSIATAGTGYTLTATAAAPGVAASTSSAFTITAATANHVAAITSDHQSATVGTAVAVAPAVIVKDQFGNPVAGVSLMFAVATGGGSLTGTNPVTTNGSGIAAIASWTLGSLTGTNTVTATASGLTGSPVSFTATGTVGTVSAAQSTVAVAPPAIPASTGMSASTITVTARDASGNPISGANVVLAATGTGNALTQPAGPTNASGVVTGTLSSSAAGPKTISATISGTALTQTATVIVSPDEPSGTQSTMSVTPATIIASSGASASTITVTVLDALGNAVSGATVTLAATGSGNTLIQPGAVTNASGQTTGTLSSTTAGTKTVSATVNNTVSVTHTATLSVTSAVASQMVVGGGDGQGATVGTVVAVAPAVLVKDAFGNPVAGVSVVFAVATGGGSLTGPTAVTTSGNGLAAVGGWMLGTLTGPNTLTATAPGLAGSPVTFTATAAPGSATQLGFTGQPSTATAGTVVTPAVQVTARDQFGNIATGYGGNVIVSLGTNPGGGSLGGTTTVAAVAGVASFTTLSVNKTGTGYTLSATAAGLPGATSAAFSITPAGATRLAFTVQPSTTAAGVAISPAVQVSAQDAFGNTVPSFTGTISVALGSNPTGGVLAGGTTVTAVNGVASFADLSLSTAGTSFTLTALASDLGGTTSAAFDITPATAHRLAFTVQPSNAVAGMVLTPAVQLVVRDELGNTVTSFAGTVTVALASNPAGGVLAGTTSVAAVNGVASFTTLSVNRAGAGYTLTAAALGLTGATSVTFSIAAGTATRLTFTGQPSATTAGNPVTPAVQVSAQDNFGNTDPTFAGNVTVAIGSNPSGGVLFGTTTVPAVNGVAPFGDLSITKTGTGYALVAATPGLISGGSAIFPITAATATQLAVAAGDGQGATVGTAVAVPPAVIARDRFGNPVPGVGVVFAVASGDGSLTGTNPVTTNGDGIAAIGGWTLGALTGANSFTATSTGLAGSPVTFTATGTPWNLQWPNVPASFTALTDQAWSTLDGWVPDPQDGYMSLVADRLDGPLSPPSAIQWRYPPGLSGGGDSPWGVGSVRFDVPIAHRGRELYLGLWARVNAGFQGHSSGVQKLAFLSAHETTARADLWLEISGAGSDPLGIQVIAGFQNLDTAAKYVPDPIGHPTETPVPVARGVWHRCEIYVRLPATNPGNGMMRVWVDGVLALDRTDVPMTFESLGWVQARLEPIWGGVDDMKTQEDFIWYDHTYVSAP